MLTEDRVPLDELNLPEDIASELSGDEPTPFTEDVPVTISDLEDVPVTELIVPTTGEIESIEVTTPDGTTITVCCLSLNAISIHKFIVNLIILNAFTVLIS